MSMKTKHTPGPWHVDGDGSDEDRGGSFAIRAGQWGVASVWHQSGGAIGGEVDEANARLIAAAPELLAIAERVAALLDSQIRCTKPTENAFTLARDIAAVIALARP